MTPRTRKTARPLKHALRLVWLGACDFVLLWSLELGRLELRFPAMARGDGYSYKDLQ